METVYAMDKMGYAFPFRACRMFILPIWAICILDVSISIAHRVLHTYQQWALNKQTRQQTRLSREMVWEGPALEVDMEEILDAGEFRNKRAI